LRPHTRHAAAAVIRHAGDRPRRRRHDPQQPALPAAAAELPRRGGHHHGDPSVPAVLTRRRLAGFNSSHPLLACGGQDFGWPMHRRFATAPIVVVMFWALILATPAAWAASWFSSSDGGYSAVFPVKPTEGVEDNANYRTVTELA